jgi:acetyl esterase/lipase
MSAMSLLAVAASGLAGLLGPLLGGQPAAPQPERVPEQPLVSTPSPVRGTMLMVHGGGWAGSAPTSQKALMTMPGDTLTQRGWRVVSVDYHAGAAGLQDVIDAAGAELGKPTGGLLCIYGESAGAQLALVAASRVPGVDCVVGFAPPADFEEYQAEVGRSHDGDRQIIANQMASVWGSTPEARAPNDPVRIAGSIAADVLLLHEADDALIPIEQIDNFVAARPTTQRVELESAPGSDLSGFYLHGTLSENGRNQLRSAIGSFADRAVATYAAERQAARTGCKGVARALTRGDSSRVQAALRCLARNDRLAHRAGMAGAKTLSRSLLGEVNAARAWTALRKNTSGRRALAALAAGRARTTLSSGNPSLVTVRVAKR